MDTPLTDTQIDAIAFEVFGLLRTGRQLSPISARHPGFTMADAYRVSLAVRQMREQASEKVIGRKIGFTNRTIWREYQVFEPIWGYIYDRTVHTLGELSGGFELASLSEPRLEPEIMFKFAAAPAAGMSDLELLNCMEWVAHGFEVVQSLFAAWKFSAADTVAAYGLHGALLVGTPAGVRGSAETWHDRLADFEIDLMRNGEVVDHGKAQNVLDGPVKALQHLLQLLSRQELHPSIAAGEIVTTGTLTRAMPIAPGEMWSTALSPALLPAATARFR
jgi:2-oxo-3-hexenedioate decarboxylase